MPVVSRFPRLIRHVPRRCPRRCPRRSGRRGSRQPPAPAPRSAGRRRCRAQVEDEAGERTSSRPAARPSTLPRPARPLGGGDHEKSRAGAEAAGRWRRAGAEDAEHGVHRRHDVWTSRSSWPHQLAEGAGHHRHADVQEFMPARPPTFAARSDPDEPAVQERTEALGRPRKSSAERLGGVSTMIRSDCRSRAAGQLLHGDVLCAPASRPKGLVERILQHGAGPAASAGARRSRRRCASCPASSRAVRRRGVVDALDPRGPLSSSEMLIDCASRRAGSMVSMTTLRRRSAARTPGPRRSRPFRHRQAAADDDAGVAGRRSARRPDYRGRGSSVASSDATRACFRRLSPGGRARRGPFPRGAAPTGRWAADAVSSACSARSDRSARRAASLLQQGVDQPVRSPPRRRRPGRPGRAPRRCP